jgi:hypothetical protein
MLLNLVRGLLLAASLVAGANLSLAGTWGMAEDSSPNQATSLVLSLCTNASKSQEPRREHFSGPHAEDLYYEAQSVYEARHCLTHTVTEANGLGQLLGQVGVAAGPTRTKYRDGKPYESVVLDRSSGDILWRLHHSKNGEVTVLQAPPLRPYTNGEAAPPAIPLTLVGCPLAQGEVANIMMATPGYGEFFVHRMRCSQGEQTEVPANGSDKLI